MNDLENFWGFIVAHWQKLLEQTVQHIGLTLISIMLAIAIGVPAGIYVARKTKLAPTVIGITAVFQTIPSIALLGFLIPLAGIGPTPAIIALFLYGLLPIVRNTYTGIIGIDHNVKEAATAMGMTEHTRLLKIELPLALPVILSGIRTATVINVGVATLAAYIAAGGLGEFIFGGISLNNTNMILAGAIPAALLALLFDYLLSRLQQVKLKKLSTAFITLPLLIAFSSFYFIPGIRHTGLLAGFTPEFMGRKDGYLDLRSVYDLQMRHVVISDAVMYKAAYDKELDVISGYSTDGRIKAFNLGTLRDDKHIFPPYYAAPIVRTAALQQFPELEVVLNMLTGRINDSIMTDLNYRADYLHQEPEKIAADFLKTQGIWKAPRGGHKGVVHIGSKIFAEQYILSNMYAMLIKGYTDLDVATKTGLGGTKICFEALRNGNIDLYPEYTGTGLLVILQSNIATTGRLAQNKNAVYNYVHDQFMQQYQIKWLQPIGFNNSYALMMRQAQMNQLAITSISDLVKFTDKE
ncbi:ABC transporter permease [Niastella yeongjuensis]|uniref:ABC transporter permease n=1 Tax=Niastella yeongjuensis TaxID=354355 RepID=A0A1V9E3Z9_9BACT|nr:ABC transporter permease/substrate-binding protein [Niastella yeongjuensis]OQP40744.1 ABC transporter permease [Niastella yeongjuensis]SEP02964.1 osmoprotectant transport system permease protein [Niastella yeongjuensis]